MAIGAIAGAVAGVAGPLIGSYLDYKSQQNAIDAQEEAQARMEARMDSAAGDIQDLTDDYFATLDRLERDFDPYDMTEAFTSLYEGVFKPMDIEFQEYTIPSIEAAYSGGLFGSEASQSGAAKESKLKAQQQLSMKKGELRASERESAIGRNIALADREQATAADRLQAGTLAPQMSSGFALPIFQAEQSSIAAQLASRQGVTESLLSLPSAAMQGAKTGQSIQDMLNKDKGEG